MLTTERPTFSHAEREALFTVCLLAAFADGNKDERERHELQRLVQEIPDGEMHAAAALREVMLGQVDIADLSDQLASPESRQRAVEMAICICESDGKLSMAEHQFLTQLCNALNLPVNSFAALYSQAAEVTLAPLADPGAAPPPVIAEQRDREIDSMIMKYAVLNGALELLPQSIATMAIVPLQMKMVYRIGRAHGFELSRAHIKELLASAGAGVASQVVEGYARQLVGGFLGRFGKSLAKQVGNQVTSSVFSFASTYAIGHVAKTYYAGGRSFRALELKQMFGSFAEQARGLYSKHSEEIRTRASTLNVKELLPLIRGA